MANVISFQDAKLRCEPHTSGPLKCLTCNHEWVGVVPCGADTVECPECGTYKGVRTQYVTPPEGELGLICACGTWVFSVIPTGVVCINCGQFLDWDEVME